MEEQVIKSSLKEWDDDGSETLMTADMLVQYRLNEWKNSKISKISVIDGDSKYNAP